MTQQSHLELSNDGGYPHLISSSGSIFFSSSAHHFSGWRSVVLRGASSFESRREATTEASMGWLTVCIFLSLRALRGAGPKHHLLHTVLAMRLEAVGALTPHNLLARVVPILQAVVGRRRAVIDSRLTPMRDMDSGVYPHLNFRLGAQLAESNVVAFGPAQTTW